MRGEITLKILEVIYGTVADVASAIEAILVTGYGASASRIAYTESMLKRNKALSDRQKKADQKQKLYMMLSKLRREGLIQEKEKDGKKILYLSERGKGKLLVLKEKLKIHLPHSSGYLNKRTKNKNLTIVTFDIPEKERRKRDWLRVVLRTLNFSMIQKSVWIGKTKLPTKFLTDLSEMRLLDFVEVFEISKTGSLRHVT